MSKKKEQSTLPDIHMNIVTHNTYSGGNLTALVAAQVVNKYPTAEWMTYLQGKERMYQVRKGEHGTKILKIVPKPNGKAVIKIKGKKKKFIPMHYVVFNIAQFDKVENVKGMVAA